jgi:hypothetical protein
MGYREILPGTGRGTIRRMVEGARYMHRRSWGVPPPSASADAKVATSPCRGGF